MGTQLAEGQPMSNRSDIKARIRPMNNSLCRRHLERALKEICRAQVYIHQAGEDHDLVQSTNEAAMAIRRAIEEASKL